VAAVLLALCRLVVFYRSGRASRYPAPESRWKTALLSCASSLVSRTNWRAPSVIVELKAVQELTAIHEAQILSYLKLSGCPVGLLINFNVRQLTEGIKRFRI
jgi:hypothetical protein